MKIRNKKIASMAALIAASLSAAHAQTITAWTFDNDYVVPTPPATIDINASPAPSTGSGTATALGMTSSYNGTNNVSNPDILSSTGSSTGSSLPYAWRVRGYGAAPNGGNGWSSSAPIGTQGAEFDASTVGFDNISISFDIDTTSQAEANLQLEYTVNGSTWLNATLSSAGSLGTLETGTGPNTVNGSYVKLGSGWNNVITSSINDVNANNDANFGIRIVNASTGADNLNVGGTAYNNSSGNWRYDNVIISGTAVPEPSSLALGGLAGLTALVSLRRFKNRQ
jgi:hypothetical protein